jgi:hypothetical protein
MEHGPLWYLLRNSLSAGTTHERSKDPRRDCIRPWDNADGLRLARSASAGGRAAAAPQNRWTSRHFRRGASTSCACSGRFVAGERTIPSVAAWRSRPSGPCLSVRHRCRVHALEPGQLKRPRIAQQVRKQLRSLRPRRGPCNAFLYRSADFVQVVHPPARRGVQRILAMVELNFQA